MSILITVLGDNVAGCKFEATIDGTKFEAAYMGELDGEYAFLINGKLEAVDKKLIDDYYEEELEKATSGDLEFDTDGVPRDVLNATEVYDDGATVIDDTDGEPDGFTLSEMADADDEFTAPIAQLAKQADVYDAHQGETADEIAAAASLQAEAEADITERVAIDRSNDVYETPLRANRRIVHINDKAPSELMEHATAVLQIATDIAVEQPAPVSLVLEGLPSEAQSNTNQKAVNMPDNTLVLEDTDLATRVRSLEEDFLSIRETFSSPECLEAVSRITEALHDSVLHESHKTVDQTRRMLEVMVKVYITTPSHSENGKPVYPTIRVMDRNIQPEDIANLPRHRLFDVMSILGTEFSRLRQSHYRLDVQHDVDNERIMALTNEADKLRKQLAQRESEIAHLRENRDGLTAHEAQDLIDVVLENDRRMAVLTTRMLQMSDAQDAYVLYMPTGDSGVYLAFDKDKGASFVTSISTKGNEAAKVLMTANELEAALPRLYDWIEKALLTPQAKEKGLHKMDKITLIPMQVMYRNSKPVTLSLVDGKAKVEIAKEIGDSPMPIRDLQRYMEAPSMHGLSLAKLQASRKQVEDLERSVEAQRTGGLALTPSETPLSALGDDSEEVEDFSETTTAPRSSTLRRSRFAGRVIAETETEIETETAAEEAEEIETEETELETETPVVNTARRVQSSLMSRISAKMANLRRGHKAAKDEPEDESEEAAEVEAEEIETEAPAKAPRAARRSVPAKAPARKQAAPKAKASAKPSKIAAVKAPAKTATKAKRR